MEVFNQVMEASTVIKLSDHVADYMIEKSYPGPARGWPGAAKSQVGEE